MSFFQFPRKGTQGLSPGERHEPPDPAAPVPIILLRGGQDEMVPPVPRENSNGRVHDTPEEQVAAWVEANDCRDSDFSEVTLDYEDEIYGRRYESGSEGVVVQFWSLGELGHAWPNSPTRYGLDVNQEVLQFFLSR